MSMTDKPACILTVDVEALPMRASDSHVDKLIYGRIGGEEWGIGKMMDVADRHNIKMTFFLDFAEVETYGDEIIKVGKYIAQRGHDLQIHCHYKLLEKKVRERFPNAGISYYTWYEDEEISGYMVDYCLKQYEKCTKNTTVIFRGGEYRFDKALLKQLKKKGIAADSSYSYLRPLKKPVKKQFTFENGIIEIPVGIIPEHGDSPLKVLNFNEAYLYPENEQSVDICLEEYERLFKSFYDYYGNDAIATLLMHGWSFCYEKERFKNTGWIDVPNPYAVELFDRFLTYFKDKINFITAASAISTNTISFSDTVNFDTVFSLPEQCELKKRLEQTEDFIKQKAKGRKVVIWGKGWIEARIIRVRELHMLLDVEFYISRDAHKHALWRGKPVKTFEEAGISPDKYYVFVLANTCFPEIRESLHNAGFHEYEDYYDIKTIHSDCSSFL